MTIKTYIESVNKSATSSVSGAEEQKVLSLRQSILKGSTLLSLLPTVTLLGKNTEVPFIRVPAVDETAYLVEGITVPKSTVSASAKLVDETVEDASPNLEEALDKIIISQARLKLEKLVAETMSRTRATTGTASAKNFSTIVELLKKFPSPLLSIEGTFIAVVSPTTYLEMLETMTDAHRELVRLGIVTLAPLNGLADNELVVLHTQGVALGYTLKGLEEQRTAGAQYNTILAQATGGFGFDSDFLKRITLN